MKMDTTENTANMENTESMENMPENTAVMEPMANTGTQKQNSKLKSGMI